jgi:molybdenum cofactor biosynthesis enzyme MoaA
LDRKRFIVPNKAVQLVQLLRSTTREKRLGTLIFFVTSRCNAFCRTCFYHEELNRPGDLSLAQIERISETMPQITDLCLSGGEPTLHRDARRLRLRFPGALVRAGTPTGTRCD